MCLSGFFFSTITEMFFCVHIIGKVHGSLARAGKVRGQTPKVCFEGVLS